MGLGGGLDYALGVPGIGTGGMVGGQYGYFSQSGWGGGASIGGFAQIFGVYNSEIGPGVLAKPLLACAPPSNWVLGAYLGGGGNVWFSNATTPAALASTTDVINITGGIGWPYNVGLQISYGNGIWAVAFTPPYASAGGGVGLSHYHTVSGTF